MGLFESVRRPATDPVDRALALHLKPSCHHTGTTTVPRPKPECDPRYQRIPILAHQESHPSKQTGTTFPHQVQSGRVPVWWTKAIRSLAPVRGLNPPSIPLPFHWRAETCSQTFSPRVMKVFFFSLSSSLSLVFQSPVEPSVRETCRSLSFNF